jgi:hypothetical protein
MTAVSQEKGLPRCPERALLSQRSEPRPFNPLTDVEVQDIAERCLACTSSVELRLPRVCTRCVPLSMGVLEILQPSEFAVVLSIRLSPILSPNHCRYDSRCWRGSFDPARRSTCFRTPNFLRGFGDASAHGYGSDWRDMCYRNGLKPYRSAAHCGTIIPLKAEH